MRVKILYETCETRLYLSPSHDGNPPSNQGEIWWELGVSAVFLVGNDPERHCPGSLTQIFGCRSIVPSFQALLQLYFLGEDISLMLPFSDLPHSISALPNSLPLTRLQPLLHSAFYYQGSMSTFYKFLCCLSRISDSGQSLSLFLSVSCSVLDTQYTAKKHELLD